MVPRVAAMVAISGGWHRRVSRAPESMFTPRRLSVSITAKRCGGFDASPRVPPPGNIDANLTILSLMGERSMDNLPRVWIVIARVALFIVACAVCLAAAAPLVKDISGPWKELVLGAMLSALAFALTALFVKWDGRPLASGLEEVGAWAQRGERTRAAARLGIGFALGLVLVAITTIASVLFAGVRLELAAQVRAVEWSAVLMGYLLVAAREELAFRGYPLFRLRRIAGDWAALVIVALIFAGEHRLAGWDWGRALYGAGVGSLVFGIAAIATRGLAFPIGLHAAWNFGQWAVGLRGDGAPLKAIVAPGDQTRFDVVNSVTYVVVMMAVGLGIWMWKGRQDRGSRSQSAWISQAQPLKGNSK